MEEQKMKNSITHVSTPGFLFLMCFLVNSCIQQPMDVSSEIKDAKAVAANYTTGAKLFPSNSDVIEGDEAIEAFWKGAMDMGVKKVQLETVAAEGYGNTAIEEGRYRLYAGEDQVVDQGKYIVNWQKQDGQWKLRRDIWNTSNPAPHPRAALNDTVWIVSNRVKADKVKWFEDYNLNILGPATAEYYPMMRNTVRLLKPVKQNKDGTYTYLYLMDPAIDPDHYDMLVPLTAKYGEEKANEYIDTFADCLIDGKQESAVMVESW
jgi:ketosteroid isomerase-like protein